VTAVSDSPSTTRLLARPRYEGSNIRTWIGFKHFMYLVEEGVLQWFREQGLGPQQLYLRHGLGLEILDCSVQLPALLEIDDEVGVEITRTAAARFDARIFILGSAAPVPALRGKLTVGLLPEAGAPAHDAPPPGFAAMVRDWPPVEGRDLRGEDPVQALTGGAFHWAWRARYFHCHFSDRVQHSAFVRALEEVVDRFLADRGLSIRTLLETRGWIPVVSRARVSLLAAAHMEETIHTTFRVEEILKGRAFDATMDCHVVRDGRLVAVARAKILHGYAASRGEQAGALVVLDRETQLALLGGAPR
jgi:acyl-CoA thioesterase FadM